VTAPQRLVEADDEFERDLIRSAHVDRPSHRALERMLLGLGAEVAQAPSAISSSTSGAAASGKLGAAVLAKWLVAGMALGLAAVGGAELLERTLEQRSPRTAEARAFVKPSFSLATSADSVAPAALGEGTRSAAQTPSSPSIPDAHARGTASPVLEAAAAPSALSSPSASDRSPSAPSLGLPARGSFALEGAQAPLPTLAEETRLLDGARHALAGGQAGSALLFLQAYERTFPKGALRPEASVLMVRTLLAAGDREGAEAVGQHVIERAPRSEHAAAVRAALGLRSNP